MRLAKSLNFPQVADRWQASPTLSKISSVLCKLQPGHFPVDAVYALPLGLQSSPAFASVKEHAESALLSVFGDALTVATSPTLIGRFVYLPYPAVLVILQSNTLVTDAEATVLLLLKDWCYGDPGQACTHDELQQLHSHIRYSRLSAPFLTELCDDLVISPLTNKQSMELVYFRMLSVRAQKASMSLKFLDNPEGWYLPPRASTTNSSVTPIILTLRMSESHLHKLLYAAFVQEDTVEVCAEIASERTYAHGFWWVLQICCQSEGIWCAIKVCAAVSFLDSTDERQTFGITCDYSIRICGETPAFDMMLDAGEEEPVDSVGSGVFVEDENGLPSGPKEIKWWKPHVVNGFITIEATVSRIYN